MSNRRGQERVRQALRPAPEHQQRPRPVMVTPPANIDEETGPMPAAAPAVRPLTPEEIEAASSGFAGGFAPSEDPEEAERQPEEDEQPPEEPQPGANREPDARAAPGHFVAVGQNCGGCHHFRRTSHPKAPIATGICTAHPPYPALLGVQPHPITGKPQMMVEKMWPPVFAHDSCGEFTPKNPN
ncbi:MAG: hypothetical protein ACREQ5_06775 [Candidatus Dormibacteria bacterium]